MSENGPLVALIHGVDSTLGKAVALELSRHDVLLVLAAAQAANGCLSGVEFELSKEGARVVALEDVGQQPDAGEVSVEALLVQRAGEAFGRLDALVNLCVPSFATSRQFLREYPSRLLDRTLAASSLITNSSTRASVVNHCFMPAMFAGTCLEQEMPMLKGAITGVMRFVCRKFGPQGLRVNTVQTGFLDMPETKALASPEVLALKPPVGRWGTPEEVAKLISFFVVRNGYMTGQAVIMDGGLTAGITGT
jgi:NAD(P)-dependent dehydrogenase (short-subunit alcohol dehydrogenase family)